MTGQRCPSQWGRIGPLGVGPDMGLLFGVFVFLKIKTAIPYPRCLKLYVFRYPVCIKSQSNSNQRNPTSLLNLAADQSPHAGAVCGGARFSAKSVCLLTWVLHMPVHVCMHTCEYTHLHTVAACSRGGWKTFTEVRYTHIMSTNLERLSNTMLIPRAGVQPNDLNKQDGASETGIE